MKKSRNERKAGENRHHLAIEQALTVKEERESGLNPTAETKGLSFRCRISGIILHKGVRLGSWFLYILSIHLSNPLHKSSKQGVSQLTTNTKSTGYCCEYPSPSH